MRTSISLDEDLAERLREISHLTRCFFTEVLNTTLRESLQRKIPSSAEPYVTIPWNSGFAPGIDPTKLNHLSDEIEDEEIIQRLELHH